jgi:hypothetical protein
VDDKSGTPPALGSLDCVPVPAVSVSSTMLTHTFPALFALGLCLATPAQLQAQALGAPLRSWSADSSREWRMDTRSTRSHTGTGLLVGGIVGAVATTVFLAGFCSDPDTQCGADEVGRAVLFIAVPAALVGTLIGSLIRTKR